ncbi:MAG: DNA polymerase III subunit chi [Gammaproteobacteria bacterium]|nr:DNA polymerase III subunit chi [Gammaproteobacteria bacterium]
MTKVDFYLLGDDAQAGHGVRERLACRLVEKAFRLGHRVYLLAPDKPSAVELDDLLWTFSQGSFVPHALWDGADPNSHPVWVGHEEPPAELNDVLVSLSPAVPGWFSRFARVAEPVGADETGKAEARERYRYYRERGVPLDTHNL